MEHFDRENSKKRKFLSEGLKGAVLHTDDFRLAAIRTYLNLGFSPVIVHENQPARWNVVLAQLGLPPLCAEQPSSTATKKL